MPNNMPVKTLVAALAIFCAGCASGLMDQYGRLPDGERCIEVPISDNGALMWGALALLNNGPMAMGATVGTLRSPSGLPPCQHGAGPMPPRRVWRDGEGHDLPEPAR